MGKVFIKLLLSLEVEFEGPAVNRLRTQAFKNEFLIAVLLFDTSSSRGFLGKIFY